MTRTPPRHARFLGISALRTEHRRSLLAVTAVKVQSCLAQRGYRTRKTLADSCCSLSLYAATSAAPGQAPPARPRPYCCCPVQDWWLMYEVYSCVDRKCRVLHGVLSRVHVLRASEVHGIYRWTRVSPFYFTSQMIDVVKFEEVRRASIP